jgi:hypothetical protein
MSRAVHVGIVGSARCVANHGHLTATQGGAIRNSA